MPRVALPFGIRTPPAKREAYRHALAAVQVEPVETAPTLAGLDGLLLAGGSDVNPVLYGAAPLPQTGAPDHGRDALETALLREALDRDLPVLAICRGLQLLNVALGGTLTQHVDGHKQPGDPGAHRVAIAPHSRLHAILGVEEYTVNSRHHQSIGRLAPGLQVAATAPDGVVEAVELPRKRFVIAVQWHPEDRAEGPDGRLFQAFRDALMPAAAPLRPAAPTAAVPAQKSPGRPG